MDSHYDPAELHHIETGHRQRAMSSGVWTICSCNDCDWFSWRSHPHERNAEAVDFFAWDKALH